jgi:undecaprenyl-diphosphatase
MTLWEAILLGIVQGIFMFFPVSSTSHMTLLEHLLISLGSDLPPPESPEMILFKLVVHVGTLVSIAVVFRKSLSRYISQTILGFSELARGGDDPVGRLYVRLTMFGALSFVATGVIGLVARQYFLFIFAEPLMISLTLVVTGIILWWTDVLGPRPLGLRQINTKVSLAVGIGQGLALMPGLSRSGTTIAFALFAGLKRRWAAEYSFFIAFPTILAASLVQGVDVWQGGGLQGVGVGAMVVGFVVAAVVGVGALRVVLVLLYRARLRYFSYYVWVLAAVVFWASTRGIQF